MGLRCRPSVRVSLAIGVSLSVLIGLTWLASTIWLVCYVTDAYSIDETGLTTKVHWDISLLNNRLTIRSMTYSGTLEACGVTEQQFQKLRTTRSGRWTLRRQIEYVDYAPHMAVRVVHAEPWWHWSQIKPLHVVVDGVFTLDTGYSVIPRSYELRLWWPFFLCTVPTTVLWWWGKRHKREGHCHECGYNLTGNVSGICPECGSPVQEEIKSILSKEPEDAHP